MENAIANLISTLEGIAGLTVSTQSVPAGSSSFSLAINHGAHETEYLFGAKKQKQQLVLALTTKGTSNEPATVYTMNQTIKDSIEADRRRGGNAQTTIVEEWETVDDTGREGLEQTLIVEIQTYES